MMRKNVHLTDVVLEQGKHAENGIKPSFRYCKIILSKNFRNGKF